MTSISKAVSLKGRKVFLRADFNVPLVNGKVRDGFRIGKAVKTISFLQKKGARIILASHIGEDGSQSLLPVSLYLKKLGVAHMFVKDVIGSKAEEAVNAMSAGDIVLLENLRMEKGEKNNDVVFAKKLASFADMYVNDAFSVSHRMHASIVGVPKYIPSFAGFQLEEEIKGLSLALTPKHPFIFMLGGAKIETKLPLLSKYIKSADGVFVGGVLVNNVLRDKGYEVGSSVTDAMKTPGPILNSKKLMMPFDVVVQKGDTSRTVSMSEVSKGEKIVDAGLQTIKMLEPLLSKARLVVWNGPLGYYEGGFDKATIALLKLLSKVKAKTIIGGGDTVALVSKMKMEKSFTFVSTGGGATLDFLAKGTLPGIKALK